MESYRFFDEEMCKEKKQQDSFSGFDGFFCIHIYYSLSSHRFDKQR